MTHSREMYLALMLGKFIEARPISQSGLSHETTFNSRNLDEKKERGKKRKDEYSEEERPVLDNCNIDIVNPSLRFLALNQALDYVGQQGDSAIPREILTGREKYSHRERNKYENVEKERKRRARELSAPKALWGELFLLNIEGKKDRLGQGGLLVRNRDYRTVSIFSLSLFLFRYIEGIYRKTPRLSLSP